MATRATNLFENPLPPSNHLGTLQALDVEMTSNAVGLHVVTLMQRMLPKLHIAVSLGSAIHCLSLPIMTHGTAKVAGRVRCVA